MSIFRLFFSSLPGSDSPFGTVNWLDVWKTLRVIVVATVGYFCVQASMALGHFDFGPLNQVIQLIVGSGLAELGRRLLSDKPQP